MVFEDWNSTTKRNYMYNTSSFHTEYHEEEFAVGDLIEYCPYYTPCDSIARRVTSITPHSDGYSNGYLITFYPAMEELVIPDCNNTRLGLCSHCGYIVVWGNRSWIPGEQIPAQDKAIDLRLMPSSSAINNGTGLDFAVDKDGVARPQGSAWDIGAYEFASGTPSYHRSDMNRNGCVELGEMISFMDRWKISSTDVLMPEMMSSIGLWKSGAGC
jgi:hypothetical protein